MAGISARQLTELRRPGFLQGNMDLEFLTAGEVALRGIRILRWKLWWERETNQLKKWWEAIPLVKKWWELFGGQIRLNEILRSV